MIKNIILCGGSGTRLWPLSRKLMPKQFLKLFDGKSLFQETIRRNRELVEKIEIITNEEQYFLALDQAEEMKINANFILEEIARNTAAAIAFAALNNDNEDILFVTPSDHLIKNEEKYKEAIERAKDLATKGYLVTFGIIPTESHTGYGYIEANGEDVIKFHEKPDLKTVKEYLRKGNFFWNSGMFMFKAGVYLEELQKYSPEIYEEVLKSYEKRQIISKNQIRLKNMQNISDLSIDYAVMEKSDKIKVIKSEFEWSDVGSFDGLSKEIKGQKAIEINSKNNFYFSDNAKVIATIGLENCIVINTRDAILISKKGETQKVKEIVKKLEKDNKEIVETHTKVYRPWGNFETLIENGGYKVKKIVVKPGKRLSLQKHFHRNEHWIVVSGTAEVEIEDKKFILRPNESTYIKMGEKHRLSNPGKIPLEVIEIQVGEYTGEDDIIRIEDDFRRNF